MPENVQNVLNKGKDWWTKFSTKQKTLIISITAALMIALVILAVVMNQPKMVILAECENTKQASEVKNLLDGEGIKFKLSSDGLTFQVKEKDAVSAQRSLTRRKNTSSIWRTSLRASWKPFPVWRRRRFPSPSRRRTEPLSP